MIFILIYDQGILCIETSFGNILNYLHSMKEDSRDTLLFEQEAQIVEWNLVQNREVSTWQCSKTKGWVSLHD